MGHRNEIGRQIALTDDLTRYHAALTKGARGTVVADAGKWARNSRQFVSVDFPGAGVFDIMRKSLEFVGGGA